MKAMFALLCLLLLVGADAGVAQDSDSGVIVAHGVLTRTGKAGTLWILNADFRSIVRSIHTKQN